MRDLELVLSNKPAARDQIDTLNTLLADMKVTVDSGNTGTNGDIKAKKIAATDHTLKTCRARQ